MNLFGKDVVIGGFKLSDYGLILASFDGANDDEELGMTYEVTEEYLGNNPVPVQLSAKYSNKLAFTMTIIKNTCVSGYDQYFSEHECRQVLRELTGFRGYKEMQVLSDNPDELYYFNVRTKDASYKKLNGNVVGIVLDMECDSQFAWSREYNYTYDLTPDKQMVFVNTSDDLNSYLLPEITIIPKNDISNLEITNITDDNRVTILSNLSANEIITMNSRRNILKSSKADRIILNDFNLQFLRFVNGRNVITVNEPCAIKLKFKLPRKVGLV